MADRLSSAILRGHKLRYLDQGTGPVVVLLHGLLGSHRIWSRIVDDLAVDARVIAPDLFGHGMSAKPRGDYSLGGHACAVRDLLDHLGIEHASFVGHSLGGSIALQFNDLFPGRVQRLVLVGTSGLGREVAPLLRLGAMPAAELILPMLASPPMIYASPKIARWLVRRGVRISSDHRHAWRGFITLRHPPTRRAFLASTQAVFDPRGQAVTGQETPTPQMPTMIVWGDSDRFIPAAHARAASRAIPGSRLEIFPGAGHFPHLDQRDRFVRVLRDFLGQ